MRTNTLKSAWATGASTIGLWLSTPDSFTAERLGQLESDYIVVDLQHGLIDYREAVGILQALQRSSAVPLVRVPQNEPGLIGKVLDAGAMGVIIPMVNTAEEAAQAVSACRYAPEGSRSYGPARAGEALGPSYYVGANTEIACIPMIETLDAVKNLEGILAVPGIDAIYVGPADLSITMGLPPAGDHSDRAFQSVLEGIVESCGRASVAAGIHANPSLAVKRSEQGFAMVTVTTDLLAMLHGASLALEAARPTK